MADPQTAPEKIDTPAESPKTAETLLAKLRNKAETAVSDEEKRKYSALVRRLEATLSERSEEARDDARDVLSKFRKSLSAEDGSLVDSVERGTVTAFEKTRDAAVLTAKKIDAAVPESGELVRAAKEGDKEAAIEAGKKIAVKAEKEGEKIIEQGGQKLRVLAGSAALDKVLEPFKEVHDLESLLSALWAFFKNFFNYVGGFGTITEVLDEGKKAADGAKSAVKEGKDAVNAAAEKVSKEFEDPEKRREYLDKVTGSLSKEISVRYFGGADLSPEKIKRLRAIADESFDSGGLAKIANSYLKNGESTFGEIIDAVVSAGNLPKFAMGLAMSGILPVGKVIYDASVDTGRATFALTLDGMGLPPVFMTNDELANFFRSHAKSEAFKDYALDVARIELYRPMGLFYSLLAASAGAVAKSGVAVFADTATGANGFGVAKGLLAGDLDRVYSEFRKVETALGASTASEKFAATFENLKGELAKVNRNWVLLSAAKEVGYDVDKIATHPKVLQALNDKLITPGEIEILKHAKAAGLQNPLQALISAPDSRGFVLSQETKMAFGTTEGVMQRYLRELDDVKAFQNTLARADGGGWEKLNRLGDWFKTMKIARASDTVVLHLETADDVAKLKSIQSVWPEGLAGFFKTLPVLGFTGSVVSVVMGSKAEGEVNAGDFGNALAMALVPIYGSVHILRGLTVSWEDVKNGKLPKLSDAALGTLAVTTLAIEGSRIASHTFEAGKLLANGRALDAGKVALKAPFMHAIDLAHSAAYVARGYNHVRVATKPVLGAFGKMLAVGAEDAARMRGRYALIAAGLLAAGGAAAATFEKKSPAEHEAELKKGGMLDGHGDLSEAFFQTFPSLDSAKKREILDTLFAGRIDTEGKSPKLSYDETAREYAVVVKKEEERGTWQKILDRDPQFRDQLAKLGIDVQVVSEEKIRELAQIAKK